MLHPMSSLSRARRFWRLASPFWRGEERWRAGGLLGALVLLLMGQTLFNLSFVELSGELTSALAAHDADRFWTGIRQFLLVLTAAVPIWALYYWIRDTLGLHWRRWLTHRLLQAWLSHRAYYALNASGSIDNPDQRIAEDAATFTQQSLYFTMVTLGAVIQLAAFTTMLWHLSREMVFFLLGYAVLGTAITMGIFGRPLVAFNARQLRREADFRFSLVRVREHAEAIALSRGEADETRQAREWFARVFENLRGLIRRQLGLNVFQYAFSFLTLVLPSALIASRVLSGELEVGVAVQAGGAFTAILAAMSVVIDHFEGLSRLSAGIDRLHAFEGILAQATRDNGVSEITATQTATAAPDDRIQSCRGAQIALHALTVCTPHHERVLLRELTLTVERGQGLLIAGRSGGGKSSLLRALGGLWTAGAGRIERPADDHLVFLPQQPYMVMGSLRRQVVYPDGGQVVTDELLNELLARVNLADLPERFGGLDAELDWAKVLSIGEQQRLAFSRVLLAQPLYAMLDEATSALDAGNEANLYEQLMRTGITPVSVSHRPGLLRFHQHVLWLPGGGHWERHDASSWQFPLDDDAQAAVRNRSASRTQ